MKKLKILTAIFLAVFLVLTATSVDAKNAKYAEKSAKVTTLSVRQEVSKVNTPSKEITAKHVDSPSIQPRLVNPNEIPPKPIIISGNIKKTAGKIPEDFYTQVEQSIGKPKSGKFCIEAYRKNEIFSLWAACPLKLDENYIEKTRTELNEFVETENLNSGSEYFIFFTLANEFKYLEIKKFFLKLI